MASYTTNLNLKKPAGSEAVAIGDINNNMDTIDQAYGTLSNQIVPSVVSITAGTNITIIVQNCKEIGGLVIINAIIKSSVEISSGSATIVTLPSISSGRFDYNALSGNGGDNVHYYCANGSNELKYNEGKMTANKEYTLSFAYVKT